MNKIFAILTVLCLAFGTAVSAIPANATTNLFPPHDNGGGANG